MRPLLPWPQVDLGPQRASVLVGIGASAGGLDAVTRLLVALPDDLGVAVLFVSHLDPDQPSALVELLSRSTRMRVEAAVPGGIPGANTVYVAPPGAQLTVVDGRMQLATNGRTQGRPVDAFLSSLAASEGRHAIGIVLSGSGSDGRRGLSEIRRVGGFTLVQDETATFRDMPQAAIDAGVVDRVLPPDRIAAELATRLELGGASTETDGELTDTDASTDRALSEVLQTVRLRRGVDFSAYRLATMRRRVSRRMEVRRVETLGEYAQVLAVDPAEVDALFEDLLIRVTEFFRDAAVFEYLRTEGLAKLVRNRQASLPLRVWVVGCSTGEEAYSLAMTILEYQGDCGRPASIQIFATDVNDSVLAIARAGCYSVERCAGISPDRLARFFVPTADGYRVRAEVRELCVFARHDIARDPPFSRMDLVSCRNVLIYLGQPLQARVVPTLHYALRPSGLLLLGRAETIGRDDDLFEVRERELCVFARRPTSRARLPDLPTVTAGPPPGLETRRLPAFDDLTRQADRWVVERYAHVGVIVDADLRIVEFSCDTAAYLSNESGPATLRLLDLVRPPIRTLVADAFAAARAEGTQAALEGSYADASGDARPLRVRVVCLAGASLSGFLVLFEAAAPDLPLLTRLRASARSYGRSALQRLSGTGRDDADAQRDQLATARTRMHGLIDDHQAKTEELTAANEEVRSSNEELQSTNEELQTAKEEVLASNEELSTVNEELGLRNFALARSVDDLANLLAGTNIPIVMVDRERRIRWFTPSAARVLGLRPTDMGRSIDAVPLAIGALALASLVGPVLDEMQPREELTRDASESWWRVTVSPYRRSDDSADGAVVALVDVDALKRAEASLLEERSLAQWIVETVDQPLVAVDGALAIVSANRAYCDSLAAKESTLVGQPLLDVAPQWDEPALRTWLHAAMLGAEDTAEREMTTPGPPPRQLALRAHKIVPTRGGATLLIVVDDVTSRRQQEQTETELLARVLSAQAQERERLARELHDETGQALSALLLGLQAAIDKIDDPLAARRVAGLREQARALLDAVGRIARGLHPPSLDELGLGGALRGLVDGFALTQGIAVDLQLGGERRFGALPAATQLALYRVVQEAMTNVGRHSGASTVCVSLVHGGDDVTLRIADDGRGFEPSANPRGGMGLQLMRRRIALLHGSMTLRATADAGTVLDVVVPVGATHA